jgi:3-hydroxymyristoyl/3-hydroxydecanoyl-(acyl carrier protein) dehydratase
LNGLRYFLLDRITTLRPPELARAIKCISLADDIFADHFPGHPVMPGALIVEALAQLGGVLVEASVREQGRPDLHALLTMIERAKFRKMVRPGDQLQLEARVLAVNEDGGQVRGLAQVSGEPVAEAELTFAFAQITNPKTIARRKEIVSIWLSGSAEDP